MTSVQNSKDIISRQWIQATVFSKKLFTNFIHPTFTHNYANQNKFALSQMLFYVQFQIKTAMINTNSISFLQSYSRLIVCTVNDSTSSFICILVKQSITSYLLFCPEINFINQILPLQISKSSAPHLTILFHTLALSSKFLSFSYSYSPRDGGSKKKAKMQNMQFCVFSDPCHPWG